MVVKITYMKVGAFSAEIDDETYELVNELCSAMHVDRSDVIRIAFERGLIELKRENLFGDT